VVSSTGSPQTILHRDDVTSVMAGRGKRPLFLIDIAVPRDIDAEVEQLDNVYLYNVDHLEAIVRENVRQREQELARCQAILAARAAALMARFTPAPEKNFDPGVSAQAAWVLDAAAAYPG
jgi:glutamyl-tRNA reductase